jgi:hypothetical protein
MDQRVVALVNALHPAELALRDYLRPLLSRTIVSRIAELDYGWEIEENSQAIEELLRVKHLPEELVWPPREVLELASFHRPDGDPQWHVARLFACVILVRADDAIQPATTLAALVESAVALGPDATEDAVRYLAWCRLNEPGSWRDDLEALPFLTLGLLLAYLMSPLAKEPETAAALTATVVREVEAALADEHPWWPGRPSAEVLKRMGGSDGYRIWRSLIGRCETLTEPLRGWFHGERDGS